MVNKLTDTPQHLRQYTHLEANYADRAYDVFCEMIDHMEVSGLGDTPDKTLTLSQVPMFDGIRERVKAHMHDLLNGPLKNEHNDVKQYLAANLSNYVQHDIEVHMDNDNEAEVEAWLEEYGDFMGTPERMNKLDQWKNYGRFILLPTPITIPYGATTQDGVYDRTIHMDTGAEIPYDDTSASASPMPADVNFTRRAIGLLNYIQSQPPERAQIKPLPHDKVSAVKTIINNIAEQLNEDVANAASKDYAPRNFPLHSLMEAVLEIIAEAHDWKTSNRDFIKAYSPPGGYKWRSLLEDAKERNDAIEKGEMAAPDEAPTVTVSHVIAPRSLPNFPRKPFAKPDFEDINGIIDVLTMGKAPFPDNTLQGTYQLSVPVLDINGKLSEELIGNIFTLSPEIQNAYQSIANAFKLEQYPSPDSYQLLKEFRDNLHAAITDYIDEKQPIAEAYGEGKEHEWTIDPDFLDMIERTRGESVERLEPLHLMYGEAFIPIPIPRAGEEHAWMNADAGEQVQTLLDMRDAAGINDEARDITATKHMLKAEGTYSPEKLKRRIPRHGEINNAKKTPLRYASEALDLPMPRQLEMRCKNIEGKVQYDDENKVKQLGKTYQEIERFLENTKHETGADISSDDIPYLAAVYAQACFFASQPHTKAAELIHDYTGEALTQKLHTALRDSRHMPTQGVSSTALFASNGTNGFSRYQ